MLAKLEREPVEDFRIDFEDGYAPTVEPMDLSIESIDAVTLATNEMSRSVRFYESLGFELRYGGPGSDFTSFHVGGGYLNLIVPPTDHVTSWWGRIIFHVSDVDAMYERVLGLGLSPEAPPKDAEWGERYFHLTDPDGHELSFARPLEAEH